MYTLILIYGILLGIASMKIYLFSSKESEISGAKINDIIITKDHTIGILLDYRLNFDNPDIHDDIIYEIREIRTNFVRIIGKSMV